MLLVWTRLLLRHVTLGQIPVSGFKVVRSTTGLRILQNGKQSMFCAVSLNQPHIWAFQWSWTLQVRPDLDTCAAQNFVTAWLTAIWPDRFPLVLLGSDKAHSHWVGGEIHSQSDTLLRYSGRRAFGKNSVVTHMCVVQSLQMTGL